MVYSPAAMSLNARTRVRLRIKQLLEERGKTQRLFAKALEHGDQWASNFLRGEFALSLDQLDAAAAFLGVPPSELVRHGENAWELTPTEMRVVRALRMLPPPVREGYALLADWTVGALPEEYDLLIEIRQADQDTISALKHFLELKRVERAHARRGEDRGETPAPSQQPTMRPPRTHGGPRK